MLRATTLVVVALAVSSSSCSAQPAAPLRPHPRLLVDDARKAEILAFVANNTQAQAYLAGLLQQAEAILSMPPQTRPPENASDILSAARTVLSRVVTTALAYRLTGKEIFALRAINEMVNASTWSDWDIEKHALDTGELSLAVGLGLDWTYDVLSRTPATLALVVRGLLTLGLEAFKTAYDTKPPYAWWIENPSNWCVVTNGGAGVGALALLGEAGVPSWVAGEILPQAIASLLSSASRANEPISTDDGTGTGFIDDGSWWEGPIYSGYTLRYFVPFVGSLMTANGTDAGLWAIPGALLSARYQMNAMDASTGYKYFNWGDASEGQETLAMLLHPARVSNDGAAAWSLRNRLDVNPPPLSHAGTASMDGMEYAHALIHFTDIGAESDVAALPLDVAYPRKKIVFLRSSRIDPNASFVAVKATNCSWNHGDLDSGQFVYSYSGQRFLLDYGAGDYSDVDYFGDRRFTYFKKNSVSHNTVSFDGMQQDTALCGGYSRPDFLPGYETFARAKVAASPATFGPGASDNYGTSTALEAFSSSSGEVVDAPGAPALGTCTFPAGGACVVANLTQAYDLQGLSSYTRTLVLGADRHQLLVQDRWQREAARGPFKNATLYLQTQANATVSDDRRSVLLVRGGVSVYVFVPASSPCPSASVTWLPPDAPSPNGLRLKALITDFSGGCEGGLDVTVGPAVPPAV